ncbi:hypothetical protein MKK63_22480 [Methylobacterium sp. J-088]|uniref:hypothetical protein n=1 Tax=Methylobacterium sp. J-088 TaxID=2836664 RepID=UPI001FBAAC03|nr:hypothetical protein [Methylobacterium sp. J-088]MCJ2065456.1 hypothetical protein [Methylobacterium sp. J-088]
MDMPTPDAPATGTDTDDHPILVRIAGLLDCAPASFYEAAPTSQPKDTSQLIQTWLAISSPEGRGAVFAFAREVLRAEKIRSYALKDTNAAQ